MSLSLYTELLPMMYFTLKEIFSKWEQVVHVQILCKMQTKSTDFTQTFGETSL